MATPHIEPNVLVVSLRSGQVASASIVVADTFADPAVRVSLAGAGQAIRIQSIELTTVEVSFPSEQEMDLLGIPQVDRPRIRREGLRDFVTTELNPRTVHEIPSDAKLDITLSLTGTDAPGQLNPAQLVISGAVWETREVPVIILPARDDLAPATHTPQILQANLIGGTRTLILEIPSAPVATTMFAILKTQSSVHSFFAGLVGITVSRLRVTENGDTVFDTISETGGQSAVAVEAGDRVRVAIGASAPDALNEVGTGTLTIVSTTWLPISVPLELISAFADVSLDPSSFKARRGQTTGLSSFVSLHRGASTIVKFKVGAPEDPWTSFPAQAKVKDGPSFLEQQLMIEIRPDAPLGLRQAEIEFSLYNDIMVLKRGLEIHIATELIEIFVLRSQLECQQGDSFTGRVQIVSDGGAKRVTFSPVLLPKGIRFTPRVWEHLGQVSEPFDLDFSADEFAAPTARQRLVLRWESSDGEFSGILEFVLAIRVRPETRVFSADIVTPDGMALGGHVRIELSNDGTAVYSGSMRATGLPSFHFRLLPILRSSNGSVALAARKEGTVFGTLDPGDRDVSWSESIHIDGISDKWREMRDATLTVSRFTETAGSLGSAIEVLTEAVQLLAGASLLGGIAQGGPALASLIFIGAEAGTRFNFEPVGPGGLVGLISSATFAALAGPGVMIPAYVAGVIATELTVKFRRMTSEEIAFADAVFQGTIPYGRIFLTNINGMGGNAFVVPGHDGSILVNIGSAAFEFGPSRFSTGRGTAYEAPGQLLIHELTHAWQVAHSNFGLEPFWRAIADKIPNLGNDEEYAFGPPGPKWSDFTIEQQASIVDEWFSGKMIRARPQMTSTAMSTTNPYFRYIAENILLGQR
jgi:hypothetical protein